MLLYTILSTHLCTLYVLIMYLNIVYGCCTHNLHKVNGVGLDSRQVPAPIDSDFHAELGSGLGFELGLSLRGVMSSVSLSPEGRRMKRTEPGLKLGSKPRPGLLELYQWLRY